MYPLRALDTMRGRFWSGFIVTFLWLCNGTWVNMIMRAVPDTQRQTTHVSHASKPKALMTALLQASAKSPD